MPRNEKRWTNSLGGLYHVVFDPREKYGSLREHPLYVRRRGGVGVKHCKECRKIIRHLGGPRAAALGIMAEYTDEELKGMPVVNGRTDAQSVLRRHFPPTKAVHSDADIEALVAFTGEMEQTHFRFTIAFYELNAIHAIMTDKIMIGGVTNWMCSPHRMESILKVQFNLARLVGSERRTLSDTKEIFYNLLKLIRDEIDTPAWELPIPAEKKPFKDFTTTGRELPKEYGGDELPCMQIVEPQVLELGLSVSYWMVRYNPFKRNSRTRQPRGKVFRVEIDTRQGGVLYTATPVRTRDVPESLQQRVREGRMQIAFDRNNGRPSIEVKGGLVSPGNRKRLTDILYEQLDPKMKERVKASLRSQGLTLRDLPKVFRDRLDKIPIGTDRKFFFDLLGELDAAKNVDDWGYAMVKALHKDPANAVRTMIFLDSIGGGDGSRVREFVDDFFDALDAYFSGLPTTPALPDAPVPSTTDAPAPAKASAELEWSDPGAPQPPGGDYITDLGDRRNPSAARGDEAQTRRDPGEEGPEPEATRTWYPTLGYLEKDAPEERAAAAALHAHRMGLVGFLPVTSEDKQRIRDLNVPPLLASDGRDRDPEFGALLWWSTMHVPEVKEALGIWIDRIITWVLSAKMSGVERQTPAPELAR